MRNAKTAETHVKKKIDRKEAANIILCNNIAMFTFLSA